MGHDEQCAYNDEDCGCARRAATRRRERVETAIAYRFIMLGAHVSAETYPLPLIARPLRITFGERFGMTEEGAFVLTRHQ